MLTVYSGQTEHLVNEIPLEWCEEANQIAKSLRAKSFEDFESKPSTERSIACSPSALSTLSAT